MLNIYSGNYKDSWKLVLLRCSFCKRTISSLVQMYLHPQNHVWDSLKKVQVILPLFVKNKKK